MSKEVELLKTIFKDSPDILELLNEIDKEIERLKEQLNDEIDEELKQSEIMVKKQKEIERLNNIIKEVREYIENKEIDTLHFNSKDFLDTSIAGELLEILDKAGSDKE